METILIYILKTTTLLSLSYIGYRCLLAKETFFKFNRRVLLVCLATSFILPLVKVNIPTPITPSIGEQMIETPIAENMETTVAPIVANADLVHMPIIEPIVYETSTRNIPWMQILIYTYIIGCLINIAMLMISYLRMMRLIKSGEMQNYKSYNYILIDADRPPFSWKKYIIVSRNESKDLEVILTHEAAHIEHKHYLDTLFAELTLVFHWFNPFAWKLKQALKDIHEYQADSKVINSGIEASKYQLLILEKAVGSSSYALANSFNHSKIKKRITMMLKQKSKNWNRAKLLFLIPVFLFTMYAFSCVETNSKDKSNENLRGEKSIKVFYPPVSSEYSTRVIPFGMSKDTTNNYVTRHVGWDFLAPKGTPVHAFMDGIVTVATKDPIYGNTVKIKHSPELETWYSQNEENLVKEGDWVKTGQHIAHVGNSGRVATETETETNERKGTRLHFEMKIYGITISPMAIVNWKEEELNDKMSKIISKREIIVHPLPNYISRDAKYDEPDIYNNGLYFRGNAGDTVYAAKNGIVNLIHDQPSIYGKIISILHEDNMQTHYLLCDTLLIPHINKLVEAGEPIALIGGGSVNKSSLLFTITIDGINQNPFEVMKEIFDIGDPIASSKREKKLQFTPPQITYDK